jgi:ketosteroid isomerase-like protein
MARNRELMEEAYAALNDRDRDRFMSLVHPDAEFRSLIAEAEGQTFRGHAGVRDWWDTVASAMGGLRFEGQEYPESGDWVVVRLRVRGQVAGVEVPQTMWQAIRAREGKGIWWQTYRTEREALEAAGMDS